MPNLTITADEEVLRWARIRAAEENTSVARLVGDLLKEHMREERGYENAKRTLPRDEGPSPQQRCLPLARRVA